MTKADELDHQEERTNESETILNSTHRRKVILAGPGTGKSFLFKQAIKKKKKQGGQAFLALTFMGKLSDELADDLAGLAKTTTLHGFARQFVLDHYPTEWEYYPMMSDVIMEDLSIKGVTEPEIGDTDYEERTSHYKAIGHNDVVHYALKICKTDDAKIPEFDLILIDEFQDFNETEAEFVDMLATKNEVLVVGDDDQALYHFKGSYSKFIIERFSESNDSFEGHTLSYCSRCTEVIIKGFHSIVEHFREKGNLGDRVEKEYKFYPPDKAEDSANNPKIVLIEGIGPNAIPKLIRNNLSAILKDQEIKSVLVLGEPRTCKGQLKSIAKKLREFGFVDVRHSELAQQHNIFSLKTHVVAGYEILSKESNDLLGWRLLMDELEDEDRKRDIIANHYNDSDGFIDAIPKKLKDITSRNRKTLKRIQTKPESNRRQIAESSMRMLAEGIVEGEKKRDEVLMDQIIGECRYLSRPLANLSITVCNILGAKGLSADIVFLIGFDEGKFPMKKVIDDSEIYQFLVALTRARKRIYLINTMGSRVSQFANSLDKNCLERI